MAWCQCHLITMASLHSLGQYDRNKVQHHFPCHATPLALLLASHDAVSILNITITFLRSGQLKYDVTWLFWSCDTIATDIGFMMPLVLVSHDAIGISISVTCYQQYHKWHHCFPMVNKVEMKCDIFLLVIDTTGSSIKMSTESSMT